MRNLAVKREAFVYFIYKLLMAVISTVSCCHFFLAQSQAHIESPTTLCRLIQWVTRPPRPIPTRACQPRKGIVFFPNKFVHVRIKKHGIPTHFRVGFKGLKRCPGKRFLFLGKAGFMSVDLHLFSCCLPELSKKLCQTCYQLRFMDSIYLEHFGLE